MVSLLQPLYHSNRHATAPKLFHCHVTPPIFETTILPPLYRSNRHVTDPISFQPSCYNTNFIRHVTASVYLGCHVLQFLHSFNRSWNSSDIVPIVTLKPLYSSKRHIPALYRSNTSCSIPISFQHAMLLPLYHSSLPFKAFRWFQLSYKYYSTASVSFQPPCYSPTI
jgi:hypothetical protein